MPDQSFPKQLRLLSRTDFRRVYERRCSVGDDVVRLVGRLNDLPYPRLGLSVSRERGNAVIRNRWKHRLREAFRLSRSQLPTGLDFIVVPRASDVPELQPLKKTLMDLAWRLSKRLEREAAAVRREEKAEKSRVEESRSARQKDRGSRG
jgi:ribonuclease P protein component